MYIVWNLLSVLLAYASCFIIVAPFVMLSAGVVPYDRIAPYVNEFLTALGIPVTFLSTLVVYYVIDVTIVAVVGLLLYLLPPTRWIFRFFSGYRKPTAEQMQRIKEAVDYMSARSGKDMASRYRYFIWRMNDINACAYGYNEIAVTPLALHELTTAELAGLLAHEAGHHVHGDTKSNLLICFLYTLFNICSTLIYITVMICNVLRLLPVVGIAFVIFGLALNVLQLIAGLIQRIPAAFLQVTCSRQIEAAADAYAVKIGLGEELKSVLHLLLKIYGDAPWFLVPFLDHPRDKNRIRHIEKLMEKQTPSN